MLEQMNVLVIEDSPSDALLVELQLRRCLPPQSRLDICSYLADGLMALESTHYDVILIDLALPDSTYEQTLETIANLARRWPIVVFSGHEDERIVDRALDLGAQDFLPKGMMEESLLIRTIHHSVQRHMMVRELTDAIQLIGRLEGLLPLCSYCRKIRDDSIHSRDVNERWIDMQQYLERRNHVTEAREVCPSCIAKGHTTAGEADE